jgi:hypothetical protein
LLATPSCQNSSLVVKFNNGLKVIAKANELQAATAAA